jgi:leader peptidase (prepilin peptidase) / N-methyltransferase
MSGYPLSTIVLARLAVFGIALGLLVLYDIREHRIPNRIVLPAAGVCATLSIAVGVRPSAGTLAGAALVLLMFGISLARPDVLGMGDVKLALLILCALDSATALALLVSLELYALLALILLGWRGRAVLTMSLPLAPIVAAACVITALL